MREDEVPRAGAVLSDLVHEGVTVWLDGVSRRSLADGSLGRRMADACVTGAVLSLRELVREVRDGTAYQEQIDLLRERGTSAEDAAHALHCYDVRWACDVLRPVFTSTGGRDGWVSAELYPRFATATSAAAARAFALAVNRPNLLVEVPCTASGMQVLSDCVAEGIGVNAVHLYSVQRYGDVVEAYFDGLERALAARRAPGGASVASFGAARLESVVDARLDAAPKDAAAPLRGRSAAALARAAYAVYEDGLGTERWRKLRPSGARPQRLVWAAAPAPAPEAVAVRRVEELVAWSTVHALSEGTLGAVGRLGRLRGDTLSGGSATSDTVLSGLRQQGIDIEQMAVELATREFQEGVRDHMELLGVLEDRWDCRPRG
ncbi:transaldolase family protein [Streptomyces kronopolitis]|uniref:transaldolase family protein n=1 Tax=Streptomyces kronopolitis TaxID=1612435 RepID=UPI003D9A0AE4